MGKTEQESKSWSAYWTQGKNTITCLPGAPQMFGNLLDGIWGDLGLSLAPGARVIDLACGSGAAGTAMMNGHGAIEVEGVDYADLPEDEDRYFPIVKASLSEMPFEDGRFQCAVSQFGIEYADVKKVGTEIERVLTTGSPFQFIIHHANSEILVTNLKRREILEEVSGPAIKTAVDKLDLNGLQSIFDGLFQKYTDHPLVLELANAVRAMLSQDKVETGELLTELKESMEQEIRIIGALEKAAVAPGELKHWQNQLGDNFKFDTSKEISVADDILCWDLSGTYRE